jgi:hypothetical protein
MDRQGGIGFRAEADRVVGPFLEIVETLLELRMSMGAIHRGDIDAGGRPFRGQRCLGVAK